MHAGEMPSELRPTEVVATRVPLRNSAASSALRPFPVGAEAQALRRPLLAQTPASHEPCRRGSAGG